MPKVYCFTKIVSVTRSAFFFIEGTVNELTRMRVIPSKNFSLMSLKKKENFFCSNEHTHQSQKSKRKNIFLEMTILISLINPKNIFLK